MFPYLNSVLEKFAEEEQHEEHVVLTPEELVAELEEAVNEGELTEEEALEVLQHAEELLQKYFEKEAEEKKSPKKNNFKFGKGKIPVYGQGQNALIEMPEGGMSVKQLMKVIKNKKTKISTSPATDRVVSARNAVEASKLKKGPIAFVINNKGKIGLGILGASALAGGGYALYRHYED